MRPRSANLTNRVGIVAVRSQQTCISLVDELTQDRSYESTLGRLDYTSKKDPRSVEALTRIQTKRIDCCSHSGGGCALHLRAEG